MGCSLSASSISLEDFRFCLSRRPGWIGVITIACAVFLPAATFLCTIGFVIATLVLAFVLAFLLIDGYWLLRDHGYLEPMMFSLEIVLLFFMKLNPLDLPAYPQ
eukprot:707881_1